MTRLALHGGEPVKQTPFPAWPCFDDAERTALIDILESGAWWRTPGSRTLAFERAFAAYHEARHGIAVTNGTAALEVVLAALGVGQGDEVIVPDFTFVATASAVLFTGALPVMVDVTTDTYCLDPEQAEAAITPRTKAIIVVHMGGLPADMDRFLEIARRHDLFLVEDCAHAHGSEWRGRKVGALGDAGTFSFQQSKLMTAGEGGMIVINRDDLERQARSIHDCGRMPGEWFYAHFTYGGNYRLSEWQGGILLKQLERLDEQAAARTRNGLFLRRALSEIDGITPQRLDPRCSRHGYYAFIFHYESSAFGHHSTRTFIDALHAEGIPTQASYPPLHRLDVFQNGSFLKRLSPEQRPAKQSWQDAEYPGSLRAAQETVWLPNPVLLGSEEEMDQVVEAVEKIRDAFQAQS
jgi:dTDP-4-amino-4,6-dideoxygalactose transaminase